MGKIFTLDSLREEVEKKYAPVSIELGDELAVELQPLLRLDKGPRTAVMEQLDRLQETNDVDVMQDCAVQIIILASHDGQRLVDAIGDDAALTMRVLEAWMDSTQPGEAGNSPS
jgi:hypothetical protein